MLDRARAALREGWLDALGAAAAVAFAIPSLGYPFGMDQPIHWYIGRRWLEGEMPYVSAISTKPPGVFAVHAASIALFGDLPSSVRVVDVIFVLFAALLIATFRARRRGAGGAVTDAAPRRPGELAAGCVAMAGLTYVFFDWNALGHPDLWQGVFVVLAAWILVRAPDGVVSPRRAFAVGAAACLAVTFKHVACIPGVALGAAVVALALHRRAPGDAVRGALAFTAGVATVLALVLLPFALTSTLDAFWEVMVELILRYAGAADAGVIDDPWSGPAHGLAAIAAGFGGAAAGVIAARVRRDRPRVAEGVLVLLVLLSSLASVLIQGRSQFSSYAYYWLSLVAPLGLGVAFGLRALAPRRPALQAALALALAAAAFLAAPAWIANRSHSYLAEWRDFVAVRRGAMTAEARSRTYVGHHVLLDNAARQARVADRVNALRRPGDTLCVSGFFGSIYQRTGLRCPSRFMHPPDVTEGALPEWSEAYARDLRERPPTFYVTPSRRAAVIADFERRGYRRHDVDPNPRVWFVILERRDGYSM